MSNYPSDDVVKAWWDGDGPDEVTSDACRRVARNAVDWARERHFYCGECGNFRGMAPCEKGCETPGSFPTSADKPWIPGTPPPDAFPCPKMKGDPRNPLVLRSAAVRIRKGLVVTHPLPPRTPADKPPHGPGWLSFFGGRKLDDDPLNPAPQEPPTGGWCTSDIRCVRERDHDGCCFGPVAAGVIGPLLSPAEPTVAPQEPTCSVCGFTPCLGPKCRLSTPRTSADKPPAPRDALVKHDEPCCPRNPSPSPSTGPG